MTSPKPTLRKLLEGIEADLFHNPEVTPDDPECHHDRTQLMYIGAALDEHWCLDCPAKIRVWSASP